MLVSETFDRGCTPRSRPPPHSRSHERAVASGCDSPLPSAVPLPTHQQLKLVAGPRNQLHSPRKRLARDPITRPPRQPSAPDSRPNVTRTSTWSGRNGSV